MAVTLLSNESVVGTLTPNVYINNITLEETGQTNLNDKNSSLVSIHTAYTEKNVNIMTGEGMEVILNAAQEDMLTNPASMAYSDGKLRVKVDMVLKEATGGLAEFWSNSEEINEYVKIMCVYTTNSLATKILSIGSNMLRLKRNTLADKNKIALSVPALFKANLLTDQEKAKLVELGVSDKSFKSPFNLELNTPGSAEFWWDTYLNNIMSFLYVNTKDEVEKTLSEVMDYNMSVYEASNIPYTETDADGNTIKNYKFSDVHYFETNPKHVSVAVMSYIDLQKMTEDFDIDFNIVKTPHGKLVYEQIIDNFKVNTQSFLYVNPVNNHIWAGPVHALDNGTWKTGFKETPDSFTVTRQSALNTKIQDFRMVKRLEKINFDLSFLDTQVYNVGMTSKHITGDKTDVTKQPSYFTPFHMARDQSGNCRFMFGIDYYKLLVENTLFGKVWQPYSPFVAADLKANTQLINLKIKRRRVNSVASSSPLGGFDQELTPFKTGYLGEPHIDVEEIIETIGSGQDKFNDAPFAGTFNFNENELAFPDTGYTNLSYGLRFFSGADTGMVSITDGLYQYGVEVEIIDNTVNYILRQIRTLYDHYQALCIYYEDAIRPEHYDYRNNRLKKSFEAKWITDKPWEGSIIGLLEVIDRFRPPGQTNVQIQTNAAYALTMISNSSTGTPRGINTLRKIVLDTCSKLAKMAGTSLKQFDDNPHTDDQTTSPVSKQAAYKTSVTGKRRIKIDYWFPNSFDSDVAKNVGYDFLSPSKVSGGRPLTGLWTINGTQFRNRVSAETMKYFTTETFDNDTFAMQTPGGSQKLTSGDSPDTTGYTFFSPSVINLGQPTDVGNINVPIVPILPGNFNSMISALGKISAPKGGLNQKASVDLDQSSWPMLKDGIPLTDTQALSYVATKIMNYNLSGRLPYATTVTGQRTKKLYSEAHSKIKFNLNELLAQQNCTAVLKADTSTGQFSAPMAALIAAENYFNVDSGINSADPLQNNLTPSDRELDPLDMSYAGGAANYLFLALAYYIARNCEGGSKKGPRPKLKSTSERGPDFNIDFFNLSGEPGTIIPLLNAQTGQSAGGEGAINSILKALPNAIKSLLLFDQGNNRYDWSETSKDVTSNANYKGAFTLNYQNIKKVEVLGSFGQQDDGTVLIKKSNWVPLNKEIFDQNFGKSLLCRLTTFESKAFGVQMPKCLDLPVFHEYFILNPSDQIIPSEPALISSPIKPVMINPSALSIFGATGDIGDYMNTGVGIPDPTPPKTSTIFQGPRGSDDTTGVDLGAIGALSAID